MSETYQLPRGAVGLVITKEGGDDRAQWTKGGVKTDIFEMLDSRGRFCLCEVNTGKFFVVTDVVPSGKKKSEFHCYATAA